MEYDCEGQSPRVDFLAVVHAFCSFILKYETKSDESQMFEKKNNKSVRKLVDSMHISYIRNPNLLGLC